MKTSIQLLGLASLKNLKYNTIHTASGKCFVLQDEVDPINSKGNETAFPGNVRRPKLKNLSIIGLQKVVRSQALKLRFSANWSIRRPSVILFQNYHRIYSQNFLPWRQPYVYSESHL